MKRPSTYWRDFTTQTALIAAIQEIINPQPFKVPFKSDLISDLIFERHYSCSKYGLRPTRFRKIPGQNAYSFEGDFSTCSVDPPIEWRRVSWQKCVKPPQTDWDRIVRAMRDRCKPIKTAYRVEHSICERCGVCPSAEVHHSSPTFQEVGEAVRSSVADSDVTDCLGSWNWFEKDEFSLPEGHKITVLFDSIHERAALQALCKSCHNATKKKAR